MNKTEAYLDSLLNNVSPERKAEAERKRRRTSEDFIRDFENELGDGDLDDVFSEFDDDTDSSLNIKGSEDHFFDDLEGIVNTAKEAAAESKPAEQKETAFEVNTLEDDSWTESSKEQSDGAADQPLSGEEQDLEDILSEIPSEEDILNISRDVGSTQEDEDPQSDVSAPSEKKSKSSDQKKKGFFAKLSEVLFGKDEEDDLTEDKGASQKEKSTSKKKEKKKKEKKPKEKKPKKPKEVDLSPPLPKVPVVLIFVMSFSVMLFVILSSSLLGYSTSRKLQDWSQKKRMRNLRSRSVCWHWFRKS